MTTIDSVALFEYLFLDFCRVACNYNIVRHILCDNGSGGNDGIFANSYFEINEKAVEVLRITM